MYVGVMFKLVSLIYFDSLRYSFDENEIVISCKGVNFTYWIMGWMKKKFLSLKKLPQPTNQT